jgi:hypothetical protein
LLLIAWACLRWTGQRETLAFVANRITVVTRFSPASTEKRRNRARRPLPAQGVPNRLATTSFRHDNADFHGIALSLLDFSFHIYGSLKWFPVKPANSTQKVPSVNFDLCFNARKFRLIES